jgi:hypothetical protein
LELAKEELPLIKAIGFSNLEFNPAKPGRLCRGRERWIEPFELDGEVAPIHRLVISGAQFSDDAARDAQRGLLYSGVDMAKLIVSLFPRKKLIAFMEDGHPADIPDGALGIEAYEAYRAGGRSGEGAVRWYREVSGIRELRELLGDEPRKYTQRVRGFGVLSGSEDIEDLWESLFLLVGLSCLDSPPAQFQPSALPEVLAKVKTLVLLHRDKHGPALGIYSREPLKLDGRLESTINETETLLVPFAVPPMLARWDRALSELRQTWEEERSEPFPVPKSLEPSDWQSRRRRDRRSRREAKAEKAKDASALEAPEVVVSAPEERLVDPVDEVLLVAEDELLLVEE